MRKVYEYDNATFYLGNALSVTAQLERGSIDLTCSSPPYYNAREYSQWNTYHEYLAQMSEILGQIYVISKEGGRIAINVPLGYGRNGKDRYIPIGMDWTSLIQDNGFTLRGHIIWNKGNLGGTAWGSWCSASDPAIRDFHEIIIVAHKGKPNRVGGESNVDEETFLLATASVWNIAPKTHPWHPAIFPDEIPRRLIQLYTFTGDTVLDPFCGTGTTVWMAQRLSRKGIGVELNETYLKASIGELFYDKVVERP